MTILIRSLLAACVALIAPNAIALSAPDAGRLIKAEAGASVHPVAGRQHRQRGCRFSHGRLVCGGNRRSRDHDRFNRGRSNRHGGGRY